MSKPNRVHTTLAYTTEVLTWVSTGTVAGTISSALIDRSETLVSSTAAVSSGNGAYYANMVMPGSAQWLVNEWRATVNGNLHIKRQFMQVLTMEVD